MSFFIGKKFVPLFNLLLFLFLLSRSESGQTRCIEKEKQALLLFRKGLRDDHDFLSSWGAADCCKWRGVRCSNRTSHVIALHLSNAQNDDIYGLQGEVGSSLLALQHLAYLDLSYNAFYRETIPKFFGSLRKLKYLNVQFCGFVGEIPDQLGNLSNLETLDLSYNVLSVRNLDWLSHLSSLRHLDLSWVNLSKAYDWSQVVNRLPFLSVLKLAYCKLPEIATTSFPSFSSSSTSPSIVRYSGVVGTIHDQLGNLSMLQTLDLGFNDLSVRNLEWFSNLSSLRYLDLSLVNLSKAYDWLQAINRLSSLSELKLAFCELPSITATSFPTSNSSAASISILDLSGNADTGIKLSTFRWIFNYSGITSIDLRGAGLIGSIPEYFGKMQSLEYLDLSDNNLEGGIPNSIRNLSSLRSVDFSGNGLNGSIPPSFGELTKLEFLDLSSNRLQGALPDFLPSLPLKVLYLKFNKLNGTIPPSIGSLSELQELDLSFNVFTGLVSEVQLMNLSQLRYLDLSYNSLVLRFNSDWVPPFNLAWIRLINCRMGPHFPSWLQSQKDLVTVEISGSGINDSIPDWFWDSKVRWLNLSNNYIHGTLPDLSFKFDRCSSFDLSSNNIEGPIPQLPSEIWFLYLSKNSFQGSMVSLCNQSGSRGHIDLSDNLLSGRLPDCWKNFKQLFFLNLANNKFSGPIPNSIGQLRQIRSLHLRNNSLEGELPVSLQQCTKLSVLDLGRNKFTGKIPVWLGRSLTSLVILSLRSNELNGSIPAEICNMKMIQILDLSVNNFSGMIPKCLRNFTIMAMKGSSNPKMDLAYSVKGVVSSVFEYSEAALLVWKGKEAEYGNTLGLVKSIDLSSNQLNGEIPKEIIYLEGLVALNLSRNNLAGKIPLDIGHLNLLQFLDLSRNHLSGMIPTSLSQLNNIGLLDLSNNNLWGKIPSSTQLQSFNASAYSGNPGLCGPPLPLCPEDQGNLVPGSNQDFEIQEDERFINSGFYAALGIGFAVGLWGTLGSLLLNSSWRVAYFRWVTTIQDSLYVTMAVNMVKLKRWLQR